MPKLLSYKDKMQMLYRKWKELLRELLGTGQKSNANISLVK